MTDAPALLRSARAVLLDFDGPVTPLMPAPLNMQAADAARAALARDWIYPAETRTMSDHLAIIRWAGAYAREALPDVEAACIAAEIDVGAHLATEPGRARPHGRAQRGSRARRHRPERRRRSRHGPTSNGGISAPTSARSSDNPSTSRAS